MTVTFCLIFSYPEYLDTPKRVINRRERFITHTSLARMMCSAELDARWGYGVSRSGSHMALTETTSTDSFICPALK